MRRRLSCSALAVAMALSVGTPPIRGQASPDRVAGIELAASANIVEKDVKVEGLFFLPRSTKRIRAVIVLINYGNTWRLYESAAWRKAAESTESALLLTRVSFVSAMPLNPQREIWRDASVGGGDGLLTVLRQLASDSRHPELTDIPLAFWGWSAAAGFGPTFAKQHPQRTLAFIRYHTHQRAIPVDLHITKDIPALLLAGGKDTTAGVEDAETLWRRARALGAPWTFVIEPNVPHGIIDGNVGIEFFSNSNQLMIPWIEAVVRQRVPQAGVTMRTISDGVGWIGDNRTGEVWPSTSFAGSRSDKTWLPDESSARAWQLIRVAEKPGKPIE
jgi:hypothetical protein